MVFTQISIVRDIFQSGKIRNIYTLTEQKKKTRTVVSGTERFLDKKFVNTDYLIIKYYISRGPSYCSS